MEEDREQIAEDRRMAQDLHKELMLIRANYADLLDSLTKWNQRFTELWHRSDDKLNGTKSTD